MKIKERFLLIENARKYYETARLNYWRVQSKENGFRVAEHATRFNDNKFYGKVPSEPRFG